MKVASEHLWWVIQIKKEEELVLSESTDSLTCLTVRFLGRAHFDPHLKFQREIRMIPTEYIY